MTNIAIYLRKSRDDGLESIEDTLKRHESQLLQYCARNSLNVCRIYKEVVSGDTIENRPQMQALLDDVAADLYDGVVCMEIERLSRGNVIDQVEILDTFKSSNTKIYTLSKVYDLTKEEIDEEYFEFALFMSRREYKTIKRRLLRGRVQAQKEGYYTGSVVPYGFSKEKQGKGYVLVENPEESEVVKLIFEKYAAGCGVCQIAKYLNRNGIKTQKGKLWSNGTINGIIKSRVYTGFIHHAGEWYKGKHNGFIDPELFEAANMNIKHPAPRINDKKPFLNPLSSLVRCKKCGYRMVRKKGASSVYLVCESYGCNQGSTKLEKVENRLIEELKDALQDFNYFLESAPSKDDSAVLKKQIEKKKAMLVRACEMLEKGVYSIETYKSRVDALEAEIKAINESIEAIRENDKERAVSAIPKIEKVLELYPGLDPAAKNKILKSIIEKIEYDKVGDDFTLDITLLV